LSRSIQELFEILRIPSHATLALKAAINPKVVQERLGHASDTNIARTAPYGACAAKAGAEAPLLCNRGAPLTGMLEAVRSSSLSTPPRRRYMSVCWRYHFRVLGLLPRP
jgi:hypothetical protein